jgi:hydrogenase maturation protein HypF
MRVIEGTSPAPTARRLRVHGIVQGVGFRPFVYRLATAHQLTGWVFNGSDGVDIHVEGPDEVLEAFALELVSTPPPAAAITSVDSAPALCAGCQEFEIRDGARTGRLTARISPDLPVCAACLEELFDASNRRYRYPYINCTACGPRYSIVQSLPYDRPRTTTVSAILTTPMPLRPRPECCATARSSR